MGRTSIRLNLQSVRRFDLCRLTAAVGSQQANDLPLGETYGQIVHSHIGTIFLGQNYNFYQIIHY